MFKQNTSSFKFFLLPVNKGTRRRNEGVPELRHFTGHLPVRQKFLGRRSRRDGVLTSIRPM